MKTPRFSCRIWLAAFAAFALSTLPLTTANAASDHSAATDKNAPALPVTVSFTKGEAVNQGGRYIAHVTNISKETLHLKATVLWSVQSHDRPKSNDFTHQLKAGDTWTLKGLAVADRVTLTAKGYAPVEETVKSMP